ncbi:O-antigen polymerase [Sporomusa sp. GT1]|uniref:O-antigen polymerase n=1 Tax=Sporomusa sp. GT1 TaxID=1534747 RepID=UPI00166473B5|nr:O-antigen polymerase [Sporomusa sp. GT1]
MIEILIITMIIGFAIPIMVHKELDVYMPSCFLLVSYIIPIAIGTLYYLLTDFFINTHIVIVLGIITFFMTTSYAVSYCFFYKTRFNIFTKIFNIFYLDFSKSVVLERVRLSLFCLLFIYFFLLVILIQLTGLDPISSPLWFRIKASHEYGIIYALFQFIPLYLVIYAYYNNFLRKKWLDKAIYLFTFILSLVLMFFSGSRIMLLHVMFILLILRKIFEIRTLSIIKIMLFGISGIIFAIYYQLYRLNDSINLITFVDIITNVNLDNTLLWEFVLRFDGFANLYKVLVEIDIGNLEFLYGQSIINFFLMFIPRGIYPDKPLMTNMDIHKHFLGEFTAGVADFNSGYMMAEAYLNFHIMGVVVYSIIWGMFVAALDRHYKVCKKDNKKSGGFLLFYLPILFYMAFPTHGFNGMFTQQVVIVFTLSIIQVLLLRTRILI